MVVCHWQNHQPGVTLILIVLLNLPNLFPLLGLARMRGSYSKGNPSTIFSLVLLLGLISRFPTNELRVATNAPKRPRIDYDSVTMSKNALGIWYESRTIFRIGEFVAKVLNRILDRPTNCKNSLQTVRISQDLHELSTIQPRIQIFVNSWDSGPVWNRGTRYNEFRTCC